MSEYNPHIKYQLNLMQFPLQDPREIWNLFLKQATLRGKQHLIVTRLEYRLVYLGQEKPPLLDPCIAGNAPEVEAHFPVAQAAYQDQENAIQSIKMQYLEYLEKYCNDIYLDILQEVGGEQGIGPLTIPQITLALRNEIKGTNIPQRMKTKAIVAATTIDTTHDRPARNLRNLLRMLLAKLLSMGYEYAPADILQLVQHMWLEHTPFNNLAQMAYSEAHTNENLTAAQLLDAMVDAETKAINQGSRLISQTSGAVYGANKAVTTTTPGKVTFQKQTTSLNTKQMEITARFEAAMAAAVALADKHPDEVNLKQFFCPIHGFQDSHKGADCMKIKSLP
jgi:hypothetical protein